MKSKRDFCLVYVKLSLKEELDFFDGTAIVLKVPLCEEKSVQLFRVAFFRSDFLQNPYFSNVTSTENHKL